METQNGNSSNIVKGVGIFLVGLVFIAIAAFIYTLVSNVTSKKFPPAQTATSTPISDYERKDSMEHAELIVDHKNTAGNHSAQPKDYTPLIVSGKFASGYLYVVADVAGKPLQNADPERFDSVYLNLIKLTKDGSDMQFGGHLIQAKSLDVPSHSDRTEMLFKLSAVPYKKTFTDPDTVTFSGDWLDVLNNDSLRNELVAFSSTEKGIGTIQKVIFYYTCVEGSNCYIKAQ